VFSFCFYKDQVSSCQMTPSWSDCDKKITKCDLIGWIRIFPPLGFRCSSNFRTFAQMFGAHLRNVCHCESSLQASSVVWCKIAGKICFTIWYLYTCVAPYLLKGLQFGSQMRIISLLRQYPLHAIPKCDFERHF
jgi:hypothetical protein